MFFVIINFLKYRGPSLWTSKKQQQQKTQKSAITPRFPPLQCNFLLEHGVITRKLQWEANAIVLVQDSPSKRETKM